LLDLYHADHADGATGYDRRSFEADYSLSVLRQIATPVWQCNAVRRKRSPTAAALDWKNFDEADESRPIPPST
jgi:hypothetical protein